MELPQRGYSSSAGFMVIVAEKYSADSDKVQLAEESPQKE